MQPEGYAVVLSLFGEAVYCGELPVYRRGGCVLLLFVGLVALWEYVLPLCDPLRFAALFVPVGLVAFG